MGKIIALIPKRLKMNNLNFMDSFYGPLYGIQISYLPVMSIIYGAVRNYTNGTKMSRFCLLH